MAAAAGKKVFQFLVRYCQPISAPSYLQTKSFFLTHIPAAAAVVGCKNKSLKWTFNLFLSAPRRCVTLKVNNVAIPELQQQCKSNDACELQNFPISIHWWVLLHTHT
jgi:hypothetical protein